MKKTVILARTQSDPCTAWQEFKQVQIEVPDDGGGNWHVVGEAIEEDDHA